METKLLSSFPSPLKNIPSSTQNIPSSKKSSNHTIPLESCPPIQKIFSFLNILIASDTELVHFVAPHSSSSFSQNLSFLLQNSDSNHLESKLVHHEPTLPSKHVHLILHVLNIKYGMISQLTLLKDDLERQNRLNPSELQLFQFWLSKVRSIESLYIKNSSISSHLQLYSKKNLKQWQDAHEKAKHVASILNLDPSHTSLQFLSFALIKAFDMDSNRLTEWILEDKPERSQIAGISHTLSEADALRLLYPDEFKDSEKDDEESKLYQKLKAEDERKFPKRIQNHDLFRPSLKTHSIFKQDDAFLNDDKKRDELAAKTLRLVQMQEEADETREYETQLKRARGEYVDEDAEDLFSQLRHSEELRMREERKQMGLDSSLGFAAYEDEPDDSLDDFDPTSLEAKENDQDSAIQLLKRKREILRE